jgi:hypothetical protein
MGILEELIAGNHEFVAGTGAHDGRIIAYAETQSAVRRRGDMTPDALDDPIFAGNFAGNISRNTVMV